MSIIYAPTNETGGEEKLYIKHCKSVWILAGLVIGDFTTRVCIMM